MAKLNDTVLYTCNEGGHFSQMMALSNLFGDFQSVLMTDNIRASNALPGMDKINQIIIVGGTATARKKKKGSKNSDSRWSYLWGYVSLFHESFQVMKKIRPRIVITTGSNIAVPTFIYGKIMGSKLVFIETRAHVYSKSLTGKLIGKLSDKIIVQWPEMLKVYKNADYYGTLV